MGLPFAALVGSSGFVRSAPWLLVIALRSRDRFAGLVFQLVGSLLAGFASVGCAAAGMEPGKSTKRSDPSVHLGLRPRPPRSQASSPLRTRRSPRRARGRGVNVSVASFAHLAAQALQEAGDARHWLGARCSCVSLSRAQVPSPMTRRGRFEGRGGSAAQLASQAFGEGDQGHELERSGLG